METKINRDQPSPSTRILIVDDEPTLRYMLRLHLERESFIVFEAHHPLEADQVLQDEQIDLILCDWKMPKENGLSFIRRLNLQKRTRGVDPEVIFMSAHSSADTALQAVSLGANDYLAKPFEVNELLFRLKKTLGEREVYARLNTLMQMTAQEDQLLGLIGRSTHMKEVFRLIERVAPTQSTILIRGASGTGKEIVAQAIHKLSPRVNKPFIAVNCATIPEALLESELFGHAKGAFTDAQEMRIGLFEEADQGSIFLDEIGEFPLALQVKLLRVIQEREIRRVGENVNRRVDVRVISATLKNLEEEVERGHFRRDLFYRLNVIPIQLLPLASRRDDIPLLINHFIQKICVKFDLTKPTLSPLTFEALCEYDWPGNVRELENAIEHALVLTTTDTIEFDALPQYIAGKIEYHSFTKSDEDLSIKKHTQRLEERLIKMAIKKTKGVKSQAATLLEISPKTLLYKLKDYQIELDSI